MKVILLQDIRGVGRRFEVKEVSDGYARNFLIPKKLAAIADAKHLAEKASHDKAAAEEIAKLQAVAKKLEQNPLQFTIKTGKHGEAFGSVSKHDIEKMLHATGYMNCGVVLPHTIKGTGEHEVEVNLGHGVKGRIKIIVKTI